MLSFLYFFMQMDLKDAYEIPKKLLADLCNTCILIGHISAPIFWQIAWL